MRISAGMDPEHHFHDAEGLLQQISAQLLHQMALPRSRDAALTAGAADGFLGVRSGGLLCFFLGTTSTVPGPAGFCASLAAAPPALPEGVEAARAISAAIVLPFRCSCAATGGKPAAHHTCSFNSKISTMTMLAIFRPMCWPNVLHSALDYPSLPHSWPGFTRT